MFLMDYRERTKAQLLQDIAALHQQNDELKALERECRMLAEELQSLNEDINRKKKDLKILHTISNAVHQSFDLQHIYNTALDMATTLQDIDMAFIYLISEDRKEAVLQAHRNITDDYIRRAGRIPYPKGTTWKVLNSGQVTVKNKKISDFKLKKNLRCFSEDLTATQSSKITGINRNTVNRYYRIFRERIMLYQASINKDFQGEIELDERGAVHCK